MIEYCLALVRGPVIVANVRDRHTQHEVPLPRFDPMLAEAEDVAAFPHARPRFRVDARLLPQLSPRRLLERLAGVQAAARRDPEPMHIKALVVPEEQQHAVARIDQDHAPRKPDDGGNSGRRLLWHGRIISGGGKGGLTNRTRVLY